MAVRMDVSTVSGNRRQGSPVHAEAVDEFGHHVLRIGRAATVTAQHDLVPLAEACHQASGNLINKPANTGATVCSMMRV